MGERDWFIVNLPLLCLTACVMCSLKDIQKLIKRHVFWMGVRAAWCEIPTISETNVRSLFTHFRWPNSATLPQMTELVIFLSPLIVSTSPRTCNAACNSSLLGCSWNMVCVHKSLTNFSNSDCCLNKTYCYTSPAKFVSCPYCFLPVILLVWFLEVLWISIGFLTLRWETMYSPLPQIRNCFWCIIPSSLMILKWFKDCFREISSCLPLRHILSAIYYF